MKKYKLTTEKKFFRGGTLYRIKALRAFGLIQKGELGGFVGAEKNLDQAGNGWVSGDAQVSGNALVCGDARVSGNEEITISPLNIISLSYPVTATLKYVSVGCQLFTHEQFSRLTVGKAKEYGAEDAFSQYHKPVLALIKAWMNGIVEDI